MSSDPLDNQAQSYQRCKGDSAAVVVVVVVVFSGGGG